jgi:hypothetical protein
VARLFATMLFPLATPLLLEVAKLLALFPFQVPRPEYPEHDADDDCDGYQLTHVYSFARVVRISQREAACLSSAAKARSSMSDGARTLVWRTYCPLPSSNPFGSFKDAPAKKPNCTRPVSE